MPFALPTAPIPVDTDIPFHNLSEDFTFNFHYKLVICSDGIPRIFIKSHNQDKPYTMIGGDLVTTTKGWHLFDYTGLPYRHGKNLLEADEYLIYLTVASEVLIAISNKLKVFNYKPTDKKRPIDWAELISQPFRTVLRLPRDFSCFAFSVSLGDKLGKQLAQIDRREITMHYTDAQGQRHDSGFCGTLYIVSKCGRIIYVWDTGLPGGSLQRGLLSPLNGTTQIQSISAAGSTIFVSVLDADSNLRYFYRHYDYEGEGAPGFRTSIGKKSSSHAEKDGSIAIGHGIRHLPDDEWQEVFTPDINHLLGHKISIHLIGQGEKARELRIFGITPDSRKVFYHKKIDERDWNFYPLTTLLPVQRIRSPFRILEPLQKTYTGYIKFFGIEVGIRLLNFHPFNTTAEPSTLELFYGSEIARIKLYSSDGWNIHYLPPGHEDLIAASDGLAKALVGTMFIPPASYANESSFLSHVIQQLFLPYHELQNALRLTVDNETIKIKTKDDDLALFFSRNLTPTEILASFYMRHAMNPALQNIQPTSAAQCRQIIQQCENTLSYLISEHTSLARRHLLFFITYKAASAARKVVKPFAKIYAALTKKEENLPRGIMGVRAIEDVKYLFRDNAAICLDAALGRHNGYDQAIGVLQARIQALQDLMPLLSEQPVTYYSIRYY